MSPSNAKSDLITKLALDARSEIPHYWIVDPMLQQLTVHRLTREGYLTARRAARGDVVRAEPFDAIERRAGLLFGDE